MQSIRAVLFDFHTTLVDGGDPRSWIAEAVTLSGAAAPLRLDAAADFLDRIWEHAGDLDPDSTRDLNPIDHRRVFDLLMERARVEEGIDISEALADELYRTMPDQWRPYADTRGVLACLRAGGIRTALISNVGIEIFPILDREDLAELLDSVVLSCHVGAVKPDPAIFDYAVRSLGVSPAECLMVGDSPDADAGAARLGIRTLLLPRTRGPEHGLSIVCRMLGLPGFGPADRYEF
ncbi:MAG: HAD family hydrolase [Actinobacteria bacterium]|nr:HAD family hydrolase [Actinomycetota bacterium]